MSLILIYSLFSSLIITRTNGRFFKWDSIFDLQESLSALILRRMFLRLPCEICWWLSRRSFRRNVGFGHSAIHHKIGPIHKAAFVACKKDNCMSLLDGLAKTSSGKVYLAPVSFRLIVSQPVLQERSAKACVSSVPNTT